MNHNFCHQVIWKNIWSTFPFEHSFSFLILLNFEFPIANGCSKKSILWINLNETFECSFGSLNQSTCSYLCLDIFWDIRDAGFFYLGRFFFFSFSTINNSDCDASSTGVSSSFRLLHFCHLLYSFSNELHLFEWINFSTIKCSNEIDKNIGLWNGYV